MATTETNIEKVLADLYALEQNIRLATNDLEAMKAEREAMAEAAADELGKGGAAFIHDGTTLAYVTDGRRSLDKAAIDRLAEQLPASLLPKEQKVIKYPGVADVDKREADLRARGLDPAELVRFSGARWTVQFRAAEDEA